ncbi:MAG TPA: TMEM175 family protein [Ktedonobacteraceae bacterium]
MNVSHVTGETPETKQQAEEKSENERLVIFSDGIIAIALTVAAISIKIPKDVHEIQTGNFLAHLFSYVLSFVFVYSLWKEHHTIFHHIKRNDGWLIALNSIYLALVILIPIGLVIMNVERQVEDSSGFSFLLFLGALLGASVMLPLIWRHARLRKPEDLFGEQKPARSFVVYTTWRLSALPTSLVFYAPTYFFIAKGHWYIGVGLVIIFTLLRWLFFRLYRHRLQENLDVSTGSENTTRIQLFSDAIIGIAITITAAQIDPGSGTGEAARIVSESWSLLGTYVFSFIIMGVYWLLHYHLFRFIERYDSTLIVLNFTFLLLIILMFIPARMYTSNMNQWEFSVVFSVWQLLISGVLCAIWQHAAYKSRDAHAPRLLKREIATHKRRRFARTLQANPLIFLLLLVAGCLTPIPTIVYILSYLTLLGTAWLVSHRVAHHLHKKELKRQHEESKATALLA